MKTKPRPRLRHESAIDELVTAQAHDERAWTAPIRVRRAKPRRYPSPRPRPHKRRISRACIMNVILTGRGASTSFREERLDWEQAALAVVKRRLSRKPA